MCVGREGKLEGLVVDRGRLGGDEVELVVLPEMSEGIDGVELLLESEF